MAYCFVQWDNEGGDVLRRVLHERFGLQHWQSKPRAADAAPASAADDAAVLSQLKFAWLSNSRLLARLWPAYEALAAAGSTLLVSRLAEEQRLGNKARLWHLAGPSGWLPPVLTEADAGDSDRMLIVKPLGKACGRGIEVQKGGSVAAGSAKAEQNFLVQAYIERPLLLFRKYKFDVRIYVLICVHAGADGSPVHAVYFHEGYIRRCAK
eukprot:4686660-Prymnesium_polylepis.1